MLLENVQESLDPSLAPVLLKQLFKQGGTDMIKLGDSVIAYDHNFKFYMTTNLRNPHYTPEVAVKVSLLNFMITADGLEEQLLGVLVAKERPDCEEKKNELVKNNAKANKDLFDIENNILGLLEQSGDDILDEDTLIDALADSKKMKDEITKKMEEAKITEVEIDEAREAYRPCAYRSQLLFFCVADLGSVDSMYQYSLTWFKVLFTKCLEDSEPNDKVDQRLDIVNDYFTYGLYNTVCRGLFEEHKLIFSLTLTIKLLQGYDKVDLLEWRFLLAGPSSTDTVHPNPAHDWITEKMWIEISKLAVLDGFKGLDDDFVANNAVFREWFDLTNPESAALPGRWSKLSTFQTMLFMRAIRPDRLLLKVSEYVAEVMTPRFITPPVFDLNMSFADATNTMPLVFVLSAGADPTKDLLLFAEAQGMRQKTFYVSLGQGQDKKAEKMLDDGTKLGWWVLLQNCHLYKSWMSSLEKRVENFLPDTVHKEFRLWLTSLPSPHFPVSVLESSVKLVNQPPAGLKPNLRSVFSKIDDDYLNKSSKEVWWKEVHFALAQFHALVLERKKFGPLGFNIGYGFTEGDADVGKQQLFLLLEDYDIIPWKVLRVLVVDVNYGGRITDDWDRRAMTSMMLNYACDEMIDHSQPYSFSPSGTYKMPHVLQEGPDDRFQGTIDQYFEFVETLPNDAPPEVFGFHENAEITCMTNDTVTLCDIILSLQPRTAGGGGKSREDQIDELAMDINQRVPGPYDTEPIEKSYPVVYEESMNTVLQQEIIRYNKLLGVMKSTGNDIRKALVGQMVMTDELDAMGTSMYNQQVPEIWSKAAYPSLKPLAAWANDLLERLDFLNRWIEGGVPAIFWISGFFFPQAFLTGTKQNYARKEQIAIDRVTMETCVQAEFDTEKYVRPEAGCYSYGLFMEGARWNPEKFIVDESRPKELFTQMAPFKLEPRVDFVDPGGSLLRKSQPGYYLIPCYKILTRAGVLSTTGHSTNYVCPLALPTEKSSDHWIKRGVALFTQLAY